MTRQSDEGNLLLDEDSFLLNYQDRKFVFANRAEPYHFASFFGGGAKGIAYVGVVDVLESFKIGPDRQASVRDELKGVMGASVGAITAAFVASGMKSSAILETTNNADFGALLGSKFKLIHKSGDGLEAFIRKNIQDAITDHLKQYIASAETKAKLDTLSDTERAHITTLLTEIETTGTISSPITFSMMHSLHQFDSQHFKELAMTAVRKDTVEPYVFNATNTPDLEIALGARASASIPVILKSVKIEASKVPGQTQLPTKEEYIEFIDGGYVNNTAVDIMKSTEQGLNVGEQGQDLNTLALGFDETGVVPEGSTDVQSPYLNADPFQEFPFYPPSTIEEIKRNKIPQWVEGLDSSVKNTDLKRQGLEEINQSYTQRNIPLQVSGVKSTSFNRAKELAPTIIENAKLQTKKYLKHHRGEYIYHSFDHPVSLFLFLPKDKMDTVIQAGNPVYGVSVEEMKNISIFKEAVSSSMTSADKRRGLEQAITNLTAENKQPYYQFILEQLRQTKQLDLFLKDHQTSEPSPLLIYLKTAREEEQAKDHLFTEQKTILAWINKTKTQEKDNPLRVRLLDDVRENVMKATNSNELHQATEKLTSRYGEHFLDYSAKQPSLAAPVKQPHGDIRLAHHRRPGRMDSFFDTFDMVVNNQRPNALMLSTLTTPAMKNSEPYRGYTLDRLRNENILDKIMIDVYAVPRLSTGAAELLFHANQINLIEQIDKMSEQPASSLKKAMLHDAREYVNEATNFQQLADAVAPLTTIKESLARRALNFLLRQWRGEPKPTHSLSAQVETLSKLSQKEIYETAPIHSTHNSNEEVLEALNHHPAQSVHDALAKEKTVETKVGEQQQEAHSKKEDEKLEEKEKEKEKEKEDTENPEDTHPHL